MNAKESDGQGDAEMILLTRQSFNAVMTDAELSVHREIIASLMVSASQTKDHSTHTEAILRLTAEKANAQFAFLADQHPSSAARFSEMLAQWKASRGI